MKAKKSIFLLLTAIIFSLVISLFLILGNSIELKGQSNSNVQGFGILKRLPGLWHGPVFTATPAGSFPMWHVDFRPVSPGQVSQYSIVDKHTLNYLSFFIVKHKGRLKVAMRTEGVFKNKGCVTYEVIDKVNESKGYYRFSDFNAGTNRAYTEFKFRRNSFVMEVYTNKFNKVSPLELHSRWTATLGSSTAALKAVKHFNYPQPVMVKDFTNVFKHRSESIYYTFENDPYPREPQPYIGNVKVRIEIDRSLKTRPGQELFLLLTTKSLFNGIQYKKENLKYISKYVFLPVGTKTFTFKHVHPGTYYIYSYNDVNGDKNHRKGDYMSSNLTNKFTVRPRGTATVRTKIDFVIP